jgi:hypothetical protein
MTRSCPHCIKTQYIHSGRWICSDHAGCGATADLTLDELRDAVDDFTDRISRLHRLTSGTPTPTRLERIASLHKQRAAVIVTLMEELEILLDQAENDFNYVQTVYRNTPKDYHEDASSDAEMSMRHLSQEIKELAALN